MSLTKVQITRAGRWANAPDGLGAMNPMDAFEAGKRAAVEAIAALEPRRPTEGEALDAFLKAGGANPADGVFRFSFWSLGSLTAAFDLAVAAVKNRETAS